MRLGLVSDTHWPTRWMYDLRGYLNLLADVDLFCHMWDFDVYSTYEYISNFFGDRFVGVWGNCDDWSIREVLPEEKIIDVEGYKVLIFHSHSIYPRWDETQLLEKALKEQVNIVFYGHTHIQKVHYFDLTNNEFRKVSINGNFFSLSKKELNHRIYFINPGSLLNGDFLVFKIR
jgi:putative phosphoesterase